MRFNLALSEVHAITIIRVVWVLFINNWILYHILKSKKSYSGNFFSIQHLLKCNCHSQSGIYTTLGIDTKPLGFLYWILYNILKTEI